MISISTSAIPDYIGTRQVYKRVRGVGREGGMRLTKRGCKSIQIQTGFMNALIGPPPLSATILRR